ncbi:type II toxin-antitoxin system VapC family toxin [Actinopolyspora erythraea]|uniref:type II toxin-antitoxin system VapC family toxin n=1 Tax=Actinopolyspora erythraea TaxID=414996 RepID=UPI0012FE2DB9|nr:PIN domain-containing protein [Actinopolyspora erythraea]
MTNLLPRVAVDTCVIIATLLEPDPHQQRQEPSKWVFEQHNLAHTVVLPSIVAPELLGAGSIRGSHGGKHERAQRIQDAQRWLISSREFVFVSIDQRVARRAAELALEHDLKGTDASILAAAELARCETLYTWDNDLLKIGDRISGLTVCEPKIPDSSTSDSSEDQLSLEI